jgi:hypothetical protein
VSKGLRQFVYFALFMMLVSPLFAPQLLAFPFVANVGQHRVYSEVPPQSDVLRDVAAADSLAGQSPLSEARADQRIFLTNGGWRWTWLAAIQRGSFAISRPVTEPIVINQVRGSFVVNGAKIAGRRSLSGTIAHEITHGLIRAHYGVMADRLYPSWLIEGYCDYVAGGGSLSDAEARALIAAKQNHPALVYWTGRKRVEAELARNGGSVDALFARFGA